MLRPHTIESQLADNFESYLPLAARRTSGRIVFEDFPDIWNDTNGDFRTIYQLDQLFMKGHAVGRSVIETVLKDESGAL